MSAVYKAVQWNRHKRVYDSIVVLTGLAFLLVFVAATFASHRPPNEISMPIVLIRGLGLLAIVMLHVILAIGPLARFDARFAPLLYNRRHLGVAFFLVALSHAALSTAYYGGFGVQLPWLAVLGAHGRAASLSAFPFELLGFFALVVFFVMAATSHDFWLVNLSPRVWKWIHMAVYPAYWLVVFHVALGALQVERNPLYAAMLLASTGLLVVLHAAAALREHRRNARAIRLRPDVDHETWIDVAGANEIPDGGAIVVRLAGREAVAVFRAGQRLAAVSNVCAHQGGPLGEGRIIDGCITCPWHGYQYRPENGRSPPPYTDAVPTYRLRVADDGRVQLHPVPLPAGTPVPLAVIPPPGIPHPRDARSDPFSA